MSAGDEETLICLGDFCILSEACPFYDTCIDIITELDGETSD